MCEAAPSRLLVILGASGPGKSSFLRAGLLPRLGREDRTFLPLPVIRPERAPSPAKRASCAHSKALVLPPASIRRVLSCGPRSRLAPASSHRCCRLWPKRPEGPATRTRRGGRAQAADHCVAIDQGEELFIAEAQDEAKPFLALLRDLLPRDQPAVIKVFTILM